MTGERGTPGPMTRGAARLFAAALRIAAPSLSREERGEAVETFMELALAARSGGIGTYVRHLAREARALMSTYADERRTRRRRRGTMGDGAGGRGGRFEPGGWRTRVADVFRQDLVYAVRSLARAPGFVVVSVLSLTFGIAVSTGLFSLVNATLLRPLPYAQSPEGLVRVFATSNRTGERGPLSYPDFEDLRAMTGTLEDVAVLRDGNMVVGSAEEGTRQRWGLEVSENYFQLLGIPLARGRAFQPDDVAAGGRVVIIGYHLWQDRFQGDPDVLGRTLHVNGRRHTIIGVAPEGMVGLQGPAVADVVVPIMDERENRGHASKTAVARLGDGVTLEQVQAELDVLARHFQEEYPENWVSEALGPRGLEVMTLRQALLPPGSAAALVVVAFLTVVGLILLIACSNVANLLLTRALKRRAEVAIRSAVGASSGRILVQLLTENLLLFGAAGGLSLLLIQGMAAWASSGTPLLPVGQANIELDGRVALFAMGLALGTGLTFGLAPVLQAVRPNLVRALKGREAPPRYRLLGMRNVLVGAQVGGSLVLVLVSLLLTQSLSHAGRLELGFEDEGVAVLELDLAHREYDEDRGRLFLDALLERAKAIPGVSSVALASGIPLRGSSSYLGNIRPEGYEPAPGEWMAAGMNVVTPGYLELMGIRLLRGRDFTAEDRDGAERVIMVSQAFVDRYWPGESGVGKTVRSGDETASRVVGVVDDIPWRMPGEDPSPFLWVPQGQHYQARTILHVRTAGDPGALLQPVRAALAELDPEMPIVLLDRMETLTANATQVHRILSKALGAAGLVALILAMLGIYGVVAFSVSQRTREVGLRVALGAEPGRVVGMVLREGMTLALVGLVPGLALSAAAAYLMRAALMGMAPLDPTVFLGGVVLLLLSVAAASWGPAHRAARCDPMEALREE